MEEHDSHLERTTMDTPGLAGEILAAIVAGRFAWSSADELVAHVDQHHPSAVRRALAELVAGGDVVTWPLPTGERFTLSHALAARLGLTIAESGRDERPRWIHISELDDAEPPRVWPEPAPVIPAWLIELAPPPPKQSTEEPPNTNPKPVLKPDVVLWGVTLREKFQRLGCDAPLPSVVRPSSFFSRPTWESPQAHRDHRHRQGYSAQRPNSPRRRRPANR